MKRTFMALCIALGAASLAAQTPATSGGQGQTGSKAGESAAGGKTVSMRGCLRAGDESGSYVLANAMSASGGSGTTGSAAAGGAGAAGTSAAGAGAKGQTFRLMGSPAGVNMKEHVGHTVEVTGTLAQGSASSSSGSASSGAGSASGSGTASGSGSASGTTKGATSGGASSSASAGAQQRLNVTALKHIDAKCGA